MFEQLTAWHGDGSGGLKPQLNEFNGRVSVELEVKDLFTCQRNRQTAFKRRLIKTICETEQPSRICHYLTGASG